MLYKFDKTSFKKNCDKIKSIDSENVFLKMDKGNLYLCNYNDELTIICKINVIESDGVSKLIKINMFDFMKMIENISIIRKGIKDKAYIISINNNKVILSVDIKDEIKEDFVKNCIKADVNEKWTREELVNNSEKCINVRRDKYLRKLHEAIDDKEGKTFDISSTVIKDYNTRSAKVQVEHHISLAVDFEELKEDTLFKIDFTDLNYFIADNIQFREAMNFVKSVSLKEAYVKAMDNVCISAENDNCNFISTDMIRVCKTTFKLNNPINNNCKIIISKFILNKFMELNKEDANPYIKGFITPDKFILQTDSLIFIVNKNNDLKDIYLDHVGHIFRMQNVKLSNEQKQSFKNECINLKKYIKNLKNQKNYINDDVPAEEIVKISKPKGLESYKIAFELEDMEVVNFRIERSYEKLAINENTFVYNLNLFYSLINMLFTTNFKSNNFDIYFDKITKVAFLKTYDFLSENGEGNYSIIAILPIIEEK